MTFTRARIAGRVRGSEPHGLTYQPLLKRLIQLNVNYALLRVTRMTDRMCLAFARTYAAAGVDVQLLPSNVYSAQVKASSSSSSTSRGGVGSRTAQKGYADVQFEEMELARHIASSAIWL
jgi:hypothetical protein